MMSPDEIRKKIAEINAQENEIISANPIRKLEAGPPKFPKFWWLLAGASAAAWKFGPQYQPKRVTPEIAEYCMYGAAGLGGLALLLTLRWLIAGRSGAGKKYREANARLQELRKRRAILEDQLKSA